MSAGWVPVSPRFSPEKMNPDPPRTPLPSLVGFVALDDHMMGITAVAVSPATDIDGIHAQVRSLVSCLRQGSTLPVARGSFRFCRVNQLQELHGAVKRTLVLELVN